MTTHGFHLFKFKKRSNFDTDTAAYDRFSKNQNRIAVEKWGPGKKNIIFVKKFVSKKILNPYRLKKLAE